MNLYAYVGGDPVNAVDPWGLNPECVNGEGGQCPEEDPIVVSGSPWDRLKSPYQYDPGEYLFRQSYSGPTPSSEEIEVIVVTAPRSRRSSYFYGFSYYANPDFIWAENPFFEAECDRASSAINSAISNNQQGENGSVILVGSKVSGGVGLAIEGSWAAWKNLNTGSFGTVSTSSVLGGAIGGFTFTPFVGYANSDPTSGGFWGTGLSASSPGVNIGGDISFNVTKGHVSTMAGPTFGIGMPGSATAERGHATVIICSGS